MADEMRLRQGKEGLEANRVDRAIAEQDLDQRLLPVPGPVAERDGQVLAWDLVRDQRQQGHQKVTIQVIHDRPSEHPDGNPTRSTRRVSLVTVRSHHTRGASFSNRLDAGWIGLNADDRNRIMERFASGSADAGRIHGHARGAHGFHEVQDASSQELQVAEEDR